MSAISLISLVFIETLIVVFGGTAAVFLFREYLARRRFFLLSASLAFFFVVAGTGAIFFGQIFEVYGLHITAVTLAQSFDELFSIAGTFLLLSLIDTFFSRGKVALLAVASLSGAASLYVGSRLHEKIRFYSGLLFAEPQPQRLLPLFLPVMIAIALMLVYSVAGLVKKGRDAKRFAYFFAGAIFVLIALLATIFDYRIGAKIAIPAGFVALYGFLICYFFAIASHQHPDKRIEEKPFMLVSRSLVLKAALVNLSIFWLLAFVLTGITANYFSRALFDAQVSSLRRELHFFSRSHSLFSQGTLEETVRIADQPAVRALFDGRSADAGTLMSVLGQGEQRIVRLIETDGRVLYSSFAASERGTVVNGEVLTKALSGVEIAAIEREPAFNSWAHRAAVPVRDDNGNILGVVQVSTVSPFFQISDYVTLAPSDASGYGLVSENGDEVYIVGEHVDAVIRLLFNRATSEVSTAETAEGTATFFIDRIYATDGSPDGFFYIYLTPDVANEGVFRILAIVSVIILLLLLLMTAILLFAVTEVLRPVRELRLASLRVEGGDYEVRVTYDSPDELGEQAQAFNRMSETIRRRTETLQRALREERDFLLSTVKELQTPLNIFRWTLELMRFGDVGVLNKNQMELLEQLHQTNMRLYHFVQSLNDAAKLEAGELAPKSAYFAVTDLIDEVAGVMAVEIRKKNISLHWRHPSVPLPKIFADKDHVRQVLLNVLSNAVKFTQDAGHIEITAKEAMDAGDDGKTAKFVQVAIEDNGRGIPKAVQSRIFERFFRDDTVRRLGVPGAGLGLYIGKKLAELNGGKTWFTSQEGTGSTFFVSFRTEKSE